MSEPRRWTLIVCPECGLRVERLGYECSGGGRNRGHSLNVPVVEIEAIELTPEVVVLLTKEDAAALQSLAEAAYEQMEGSSTEQSSGI